ncbi:MAG: DMT family transporter [Parachlamydiales bacterium]|nr:DMT family transporter [Parachlamydiales bacterium]
MEHRRKLALGVSAALLSAFLYACYSAWVKIIAEKGTSFYETVFSAFFIGWLILIPYALKKGVKNLKTDRIGMHVLRACFGLGFMYALVISLQFIPLVDAVMLNNTAPLFMPFITRYWLGCSFNKKIWVALILGLIGVSLILKPDKGVFNSASLLALFSGLLMAFSWSSVRKLSMNEPVYRIVFYYFFFASLITLIPLLIAHPEISYSKVLGLIISGIFFMSTTTLMTYASTQISIVAVSILYYMLIVFSGILNWLIWDQIPDGWTMLGIVLVVAGGISSILLEKHKSKKEIVD